MARGAAERGAEEILRTQSQATVDSHRPPAEAEDVHVIVLHSLASRKVVVAERRACAGHLIGRYRSAYAAAAQ